MPPPGSTREEQEGSHFVWIKSQMGDGWIDFDKVIRVTVAASAASFYVNSSVGIGYKSSMTQTDIDNMVAEFLSGEDWLKASGNDWIKKDAIEVVSPQSIGGGVYQVNIFSRSDLFHTANVNSLSEFDDLVRSLATE